MLNFRRLHTKGPSSSRSTAVEAFDRSYFAEYDFFFGYLHDFSHSSRITYRASQFDSVPAGFLFHARKGFLDLAQSLQRQNICLRHSPIFSSRWGNLPKSCKSRETCLPPVFRVILSSHLRSRLLLRIGSVAGFRGGPTVSPES